MPYSDVVPYTRTHNPEDHDLNICSNVLSIILHVYQLHDKVVLEHGVKCRSTIFPL